MTVGRIVPDLHAADGNILNVLQQRSSQM
jgi:hypothetical protein